MGTPTNEDWGKIHAKAWKDTGYRKLLETDPTAAIRQYAKESGKNFDKVVKIADKPDDPTAAEHHRPPACC